MAGSSSEVGELGLMHQCLGPESSISHQRSPHVNIQDLEQNVIRQRDETISVVFTTYIVMCIRDYRRGLYW
jgi:hypothetical protein